MPGADAFATCFDAAILAGLRYAMPLRAEENAATYVRTLLMLRMLCCFISCAPPPIDDAMPRLR